MFRKAVVCTVLLSVITIGAGCSGSDDDDSSSDTTSGAGVAVTSDDSGSSAAGDQIDIVVSDTQGLNGPMTMTVDPEQATAGEVTFTVDNQGTIEHEVVLIELTEGETWDGLEVTNDRVSEDNAKGEVEVEEGETGTFKADLEAGDYALVCNLEKHYELGMRAPLTVVS